MLQTFKPAPTPRKDHCHPTENGNRAGSKKRKKNGHPHPEFDLRTKTYKLFGVDVTQIPGLEENALPLFREVGRDMSSWPNAAHFISWLALCPDNDISGGK
jgi:transposase